jgi:hypothetical protein
VHRGLRWNERLQERGGQPRCQESNHLWRRRRLCLERGLFGRLVYIDLLGERVLRGRRSDLREHSHRQLHRHAVVPGDHRLRRLNLRGRLHGFTKLSQECLLFRGEMHASAFHAHLHALVDDRDAAARPCRVDSSCEVPNSSICGD